MVSKKRFAPTQSVCDASTLILLTKADLIDTVLKLKNLIIAEKVYEETVRRGKQKGLADAFKLEVLVQQGKIQRANPSKTAKQRIQRLFNLKGGERDTLALAEELGISDVLIDDKKGINACRALGFQFASALALLVAVTKAGIMEKLQAVDRLTKLEAHGWYAQSLIEAARKDLHASASP